MIGEDLGKIEEELGGFRKDLMNQEDLGKIKEELGIFWKDSRRLRKIQE